MNTGQVRNSNRFSNKVDTPSFKATGNIYINTDPNYVQSLNSSIAGVMNEGNLPALSQELEMSSIDQNQFVTPHDDGNFTDLRTIVRPHVKVRTPSDYDQQGGSRSEVYNRPGGSGGVHNKRTASEGFDGAPLLTINLDLSKTHHDWHNLLNTEHLRT